MRHSCDKSASVLAQTCTSGRTEYPLDQYAFGRLIPGSALRGAHSPLSIAAESKQSFSIPLRWVDGDGMWMCLGSGPRGIAELYGVSVQLAIEGVKWPGSTGSGKGNIFAT